ncbi:hypothetical protein WA026_001128 [Henosepilachna vigintioctopunctata]|uniref:Endonuclease/exonuclease/phosphatase domain-containing protein n=1 Tax=Henosepilachna vigintioctopunctata TaxID=420089 RepID=A0AAW1V846_9CUCU
MDTFIRDFDSEIVETLIIDDIEAFNLKFSKCTNNLRIFHINISSLNKNGDELFVTLQQFTQKFDIIVLTETYFVDLEFVKFDDFEVLYNEGRANKNDGVVVLVREGINYDYKIVNLNDGMKLLQEILNVEKKTLPISAVYRLHGSCPYEFCEHLKSHLGTVNSDIQILIGDMNINLMDERSEVVQYYLNVLTEMGYKSYINAFTRVERNSKSCIDHVFIKTRQKIEDILCAVLEVKITDHFPTVALIPFTQIQTLDSNKYKTIVQYDKIRTQLNLINWESIVKNENINEAIVDFIDTTKNKIMENTKRVKYKRIKNGNAWITQSLIRSIEIKNKMYRELCKKPDNEELKETYKKYRNKLTNLIKMKKADYYKSELDRRGTSSKALWDWVKKFTNFRKRNTVEINCIKDEKGEIERNKMKIATIFNRHYTSYSSKLASAINRPKTQPFASRSSVKESIFLRPATEIEVESCLTALKKENRLVTMASQQRLSKK